MHAHVRNVASYANSVLVLKNVVNAHVTTAEEMVDTVSTIPIECSSVEHSSTTPHVSSVQTPDSNVLVTLWYLNSNTINIRCQPGIPLPATHVQRRIICLHLNHGAIINGAVEGGVLPSNVLLLNLRFGKGSVVNSHLVYAAVEIPCTIPSHPYGSTIINHS